LPTFAAKQIIHKIYLFIIGGKSDRI